MCATFDYPNETITWNSNSTDIIENMNIFIPENKEIKEVFQIKEDLIKDLNDNKLEIQNIDIKEHEEKINKFNESFKDLLDFFKNQQNLVLKKEQDLTTFQVDRWNEVFKSRIDWAIEKGLEKDFIEDLYKVIHLGSINVQNKIINKKKANSKI